ncbi:uncharacterized protein EDB91DRAFT_1086262 [Suillus paluster]|uniref:uncharacterized protein n=1 Tax=Suillus paluster TaxID=48578 RepID=UPI001B8682C3|nr:uncharacterized protein EDB91DRAFT_1086262 [Suillus paluster]KAG1727961.1 hypothetical protein EDB91DRAFT_1086262 [Suillus paluster]
MSTILWLFRSENPTFQRWFNVDLQQDHNTIRLELPVWVRSFKFTFECRTPGPMAVNIYMREPLNSEAWAVKDSKTELQSEPAAENLRCAAQALVSGTGQLVKDGKAGPGTKGLIHLQNVPAKCAGPVPDDNKTEPESEPEAQTPVEFTTWYEADNQPSFQSRR